MFNFSSVISSSSLPVSESSALEAKSSSSRSTSSESSSLVSICHSLCRLKCDINNERFPGREPKKSSSLESLRHEIVTGTAGGIVARLRLGTLPGGTAGGIVARFRLGKLSGFIRTWTPSQGLTSQKVLGKVLK